MRPDEDEVQIGKIVNHTHQLDIGEIRQIVKERVLAQLGTDAVERIDPVHAAPADDSKLLTKAARAWRQAEGDEMEFTETVNHTIFWFGVRYVLKEPSFGEASDAPKQWPPDGSDTLDEDGPDPRIAEQLEDQLDEEAGA